MLQEMLLRKSSRSSVRVDDNASLTYIDLSESTFHLFSQLENDE